MKIFHKTKYITFFLLLFLFTSQILFAANESSNITYNDSNFTTNQKISNLGDSHLASTSLLSDYSEFTNESLTFEIGHFTVPDAYDDVSFGLYKPWVNSLRWNNTLDFSHYSGSEWQHYHYNFPYPFKIFFVKLSDSTYGDISDDSLTSFNVKVADSYNANMYELGSLVPGDEIFFYFVFDTTDLIEDLGAENTFYIYLDLWTDTRIQFYNNATESQMTFSTADTSNKKYWYLLDGANYGTQLGPFAVSDIHGVLNTGLNISLGKGSDYNNTSLFDASRYTNLYNQIGAIYMSIVDGYTDNTYQMGLKISTKNNFELAPDSNTHTDPSSVANIPYKMKLTGNGFESNPFEDQTYFKFTNMKTNITNEADMVITLTDTRDVTDIEAGKYNDTVYLTFITDTNEYDTNYSESLSFNN